MLIWVAVAVMLEARAVKRQLLTFVIALAALAPVVSFAHAQDIPVASTAPTINLRKTVTYGIRFTLPTSLSNGTQTLPVSWNGTQYGWLCVWNTTTSTPASCNVQQMAYNPTSHTGAGNELMVDLPNNTPQNNVFAADVYIGGRLTVPNVSLAPGVYSAPLTVTITVLN